MINFTRKILWSIKYYPEIKGMIEGMRIDKEKKEKELKKDNLKLCFAHQQESNHSHYSGKNCDYCKLLKKAKQ